MDRPGRESAADDGPSYRAIMHRTLLPLFTRKRKWLLVLFLGVLLLGLEPSRAQAPPDNTIKSGSFVLAYDQRGITGLSNPGDTYAAQFVAPGAHLGDPVLKYKTQDSEWVDISTRERKLQADAKNGSLIYTDLDSGSPLKLVQLFRTEGNSLDWTLEIESTTKAAVQIGDLAIPIPW